MKERLATLEAVVPTLATKADLADKIGGVMTAIEAVRSDLRGWMLSTVLTIIATMLAALFGISQITKGAATPAAAPQQPTIIVVPQAATTSAAPAAPR